MEAGELARCCEGEGAERWRGGGGVVWWRGPRDGEGRRVYVVEGSRRDVGREEDEAVLEGDGDKRQLAVENIHEHMVEREGRNRGD